VEDILLTVDQVIQMHADILGCSVEQSARMLRSVAGLEGALARPAWHAEYDDADLALQAAVLAEGIAEGQYFLDGNKRTAVIALESFLAVHGWEVSATDEELAEWILGLGHGCDAGRLAEKLRSRLVLEGRHR
jgi:death-on-curing protein